MGHSGQMLLQVQLSLGLARKDMLSLQDRFQVPPLLPSVPAFSPATKRLPSGILLCLCVNVCVLALFFSFLFLISNLPSLSSTQQRALSPHVITARHALITHANVQMGRGENSVRFSENPQGVTLMSYAKTASVFLVPLICFQQHVIVLAHCLLDHSVRLKPSPARQTRV